jgi:hypothetical protein
MIQHPIGCDTQTNRGGRSTKRGDVRNFKSGGIEYDEIPQNFDLGSVIIRFGLYRNRGVQIF